jgi:hypothetical protein
MKLIKEICPTKNLGTYPRRYLLLTNVTDEDAKILELCNMKRADEFDEGDIEAWMVL